MADEQVVGENILCPDCAGRDPCCQTCEGTGRISTNFAEELEFERQSPGSWWDYEQ